MRARFEHAVRRWALEWTGRTLARLPITPTQLTLLSLALTVAVTPLLVQGEFFWGGLLLLVAASFDLFDGALARSTNRSTRLGAFLDSTLDRYVETLVFGALGLHYVLRPPVGLEPVLVAAALSGSLLTSYARARAEALGLDGKAGWLERPERFVIIVIALLANWVTPALWVLALLTHVTVVQRIVHVWRQCRGADAAPAPAPVKDG